MSADLSEEPTDRLTLKYLPVEGIKPNQHNPRLVFPQDELDQLAESIDLEGILVPIAVYEDDDGSFVLVDGERRFRCAQILGLDEVPAIVVDKKPDYETLVQMFNIHQIREPWRDIPTARAIGRLIAERPDGTDEPTDRELRDLTGLSTERIKRLRYVLTLPPEWQEFINDDLIPLNFFWELKRNLIDRLATQRKSLFDELGGANAIAEAFVQKRLDGVITDVVSLRKLRPIINYAAAEADSETDESVLDGTIRALVQNPDVSIDEAYEDTVQIMVEATMLERRTVTMVASFRRLLAKARTPGERGHIVNIARNMIRDLSGELAP